MIKKEPGDFLHDLAKQGKLTDNQTLTCVFAYNERFKEGHSYLVIKDEGVLLILSEKGRFRPSSILSKFIISKVPTVEELLG